MLLSNKGKISGAHLHHHLLFFQHNDLVASDGLVYYGSTVPGREGSRKHFTYSGMPLFCRGLIVFG